MVQFKLLDKIGPLIHLHTVANTETMWNENNKDFAPSALRASNKTFLM